MKTDKKIEEILYDLSLKSYVRGVADERFGHEGGEEPIEGHLKAINTEEQKAVEDGIRGFAEWVFDDDTEIFFDSIAIKTLAQEYLSQQKGRSSVKEDK